MKNAAQERLNDNAPKFSSINSPNEIEMTENVCWPKDKKAVDTHSGNGKVSSATYSEKLKIIKN